MSRKKLKQSVIALAIASVPILSGCGQNNNTVPPMVGTSGSPIVGAGGCIPVTTPQIPMTGNGIYFDWANIRGGQIPNGMAFGQMYVGGSAVGGQFNRSGVDGTVSLNVLQNTAVAYPGGTYPGPYQSQYPGTIPTTSVYPSTATLTGFVSISSVTMQDILMKFGNGYYGSYPTYPYNTGYPTYPTTGVVPQPYGGMNAPCVSGIAIDVGHYNNIIYGGNVYLYLNNSAHGYALYF